MVAQQVVKVKRQTLEACMTCPLCHKLLRDATTISICLHTCSFLNSQCFSLLFFRSGFLHAMPCHAMPRYAARIKISIPYLISSLIGFGCFRVPRFHPSLNLYSISISWIFMISVDIRLLYSSVFLGSWS